MSHPHRSHSFDYARIAKTGFFAGLALFAVGVVGELAGNAILGSIPATAEQGLFALEVVGVAVGLLVPIVFGAVLPLTE